MGTIEEQTPTLPLGESHGRVIKEMPAQTTETHHLQRTEDPLLPALQKALDGGITTENAAVVEKMLDIYERIQNRQAEQAFNESFVRLQQKLPKIKATHAVPDLKGNLKYKYANFEDIMDALRPFLSEFGFTVTFDVKYIGEGRLEATCIVSHISGHSRRNSFAVRIGKGPPNASEPQSDGAARMYAKRGALCDGFNIVIEHDDDARNLGTEISAEDAERLRGRVRNLGVNETAFLKFANAATFEEIMSTRLEELDMWLDRKKAKA